MKFLPTKLDGVTIVEPDVFRDDRGFFLETYRADRFGQGGIEARFVQDNHSRSVKGTIRGLHAQRRRPQAKLVRALVGAIMDVVVDIRRGSDTYLEWISLELSAANFRELYVPAGFAHGICIISEFAEIEYKCTDYYDPEDELRIIWNDPSIGIAWPTTAPILSPKDSKAPTLEEQISLLPVIERKTL
jgi:dTDP-4-dehydrorhamnose 3,5-epimerase